ncbi:MAG: hypothetical protein AAGD13_15240 [Pseudomonadota bacterium]
MTDKKPEGPETVSDDDLSEISGGPHFQIWSDSKDKQFNYQSGSDFYYLYPMDPNKDLFGEADQGKDGKGSTGPEVEGPRKQDGTF